MYCGPRCLRYVHRKHGNRLSITRASALMRTAQSGTTVTAVRTALQQLGYEAWVEEELTWERLGELIAENDVIVTWWSDVWYGKKFTPPDGHYSVAEKLDDAHIHLYDPDADTIIPYGRVFFEGHWFDYEWLDGKLIVFNRAAIIARKT